MPNSNSTSRAVAAGLVVAVVLLGAIIAVGAGAVAPVLGGDESNEADTAPLQTGSTDRAVHVVAFVTAGDAARCDYEFTTDGAAGPVTESPYLSPSGDDIRATSNFDIDDTDDGQRVTGYTGNGHGDMFVVGGAVTGASIDCEDSDDEMWIELGGERVTADELVSQTGGGDDVSVTYEDCSTVTIDGEGEYDLEINTEYYGPDGITSMNYEDTVTLPETVDVSNLDDAAVTDIPIEFTTVLDDGEIAAERANPEFDDCWDAVEQQWEEYQDEQTHTVAFITEDDADRCDYAFTTDLEPDPLEESPYLSPSGNEVRSVSNFDINEVEGDFEVNGHTGNGYGDAYAVDSAIRSASIDCEDGGDEMWIELDGERVTADELLSRTSDG